MASKSVLIPDVRSCMVQGSAWPCVLSSCLWREGRHTVTAHHKQLMKQQKLKGGPGTSQSPLTHNGSGGQCLL